jgi:uncharacterized OsmC-like protein
MTSVSTIPSTAPAPHARAGDEPRDFALDLELVDGYRQQADFGLPGVAPLTIDEPPPLGELAGPNPARVLGAAVASCLGASLLFCLRRARVDVRGLRTHVTGTMARNERGRLRVGAIRVRLEPVVPPEQQAGMARCLAVFEDYCVVTASVRPGVDVHVEVVPVDPAAVT